MPTSRDLHPGRTWHPAEPAEPEPEPVEDVEQAEAPKPKKPRKPKAFQAVADHGDGEAAWLAVAAS